MHVLHGYTIGLSTTRELHGRHTSYRLVTAPDGSTHYCTNLTHAVRLVRRLADGEDANRAYWSASPTPPYGRESLRPA